MALLFTLRRANVGWLNGSKGESILARRKISSIIVWIKRSLGTPAWMKMEWHSQQRREIWSNMAKTTQEPQRCELKLKLEANVNSLSCGGPVFVCQGAMFIPRQVERPDCYSYISCKQQLSCETLLNAAKYSVLLWLDFLADPSTQQSDLAGSQLRSGSRTDLLAIVSWNECELWGHAKQQW